ncbi:hypothetical protein EJB05_37840, partial [Eragrostis curvula]
MGGGDSDEDDHFWVPHCTRPADVTLVLVGKVGYGKSATANSILGCNAFESKRSYTSVTGTCQMRSTKLSVGGAIRSVNVIDTPGLFDMDISVKDAGKEIIKSMDMAKDGIHAMLMVLTAASRLSHEDEETIETIKTRITIICPGIPGGDYMRKTGKEIIHETNVFLDGKR